MQAKWIGAVLIIAGCGGTGLSIAAAYRKEVSLFYQLIQVLQYLEWELQYKLTPLPQLCKRAAKQTCGPLRNVFLNLSRELEWQISPDADSCMRAALKKSEELPKRLKRQLRFLGQTLGRFDLDGQLQDLRTVRSACEDNLKRLENNKDQRVRSYQTLALCTGAGLVIMFI